jgi:apolipoprotein N-acyltransferase
VTSVIEVPLQALVAGRLQAFYGARLTGWRLNAATWALGVISVLAYAPFFLWPVLFVTLPAWLIAVSTGEQRAPSHVRFAPWRRSPVGRAGELGWWFGFGHCMAGLFWVGEAFLVEPDVFGWLLPFAVTLLPAGLALFYATAMATAAWLAPHGVHRVLALAVTLSVTEWLRGHIFTGFPWNVLGYALTYPLPLMQSASVFGIYGLTLIAVLVFALPATLYLDRRTDETNPLRRRAWALAAILPLMALWGFGQLRLAAPAPVSGESAPLIRIVQPSVPQREKWRAENQRRIFDDHLALSLQNAAGTRDDAAGIALIVWPEAAMPFFPLNSEIALGDIGRMLPVDTTLVSGALRADPPPSPAARRAVYNSLIAFGSGESARVMAAYDKIHLVPFGEYLPLQRLLERIGLQQLSKLPGGFASGIAPRPLMDIPRVGRLGPLICYEVLFPGTIVQGAERPRALVNVTNDGWFGNTTGPRQHLQMSRVRAVEEGLPIIRAANNGISAMIDANGRITARIDLNVRGSVDAVLPAAVAVPIYARLGDWLWLLMAAAMVAVLLRWKNVVRTAS